MNNGQLSIKEKQSGLVVGYCHNILLKDAHPVVSQAGRELVVLSGQKNVHAFIEGEVINAFNFVSRKGRHLDVVTVDSRLKEFKQSTLYYNPYLYEGFTDAHTNEIVTDTFPFIYINHDGHIEAFKRR